MAKRLRFIVEKCTACHQCELACSGINDGVFLADRARIRIFALSEPSANVPYACFQCEEAWCMLVCPVGAIYEKPETGVKILDNSICVGCKICTISCPYGTVVYHPTADKVVKCDLCDGVGGEPFCVSNCPTGAIEFIDITQGGPSAGQTGP